MRPGSKKPSKYSRSKRKQKPKEAKQFTRKRDSQTTIMEKDLQTIANNPKLQQYYSELLATFKVTGISARMQAIRDSIKETKEYAEEQGMEWR